MATYQQNFEENSKDPLDRAKALDLVEVHKVPILKFGSILHLEFNSLNVLGDSTWLSEPQLAKFPIFAMQVGAQSVLGSSIW